MPTWSGPNRWQSYPVARITSSGRDTTEPEAACTIRPAPCCGGAGLILGGGALGYEVVPGATLPGKCALARLEGGLRFGTARVAALGRLPAWIGCGVDDPFESQTGRGMPGGIPAGYHDEAFWTGNMPAALRFSPGRQKFRRMPKRDARKRPSRLLAAYTRQASAGSRTGTSRSWPTLAMSTSFSS
jgi:hypothetical protein